MHRHDFLGCSKDVEFERGFHAMPQMSRAASPRIGATIGAPALASTSRLIAFVLADGRTSQMVSR